MKRLILAALIAFGLHGALLSVNPQWTGSDSLRTEAPGPVSLTLTYRVPSQIPAPPGGHKPVLRGTPSNLPKAPRKPKQEPSSQPDRETVTREKTVEKPRSHPPEPVEPDMGSPPPAGDTGEKREPAVADTFSPALPEPGAAAGISSSGDPGRGTPAVPPRSPSPAADEEPESGRARASRPSGDTPEEVRVPGYRRTPAPPYPQMARRRGYEGTALVDVLVGEQGRAIQVKVAQSTGYPVLDRAAVAAVRDWVFIPGRRGGETTAMWVKVPIRFQLR